MLSSFLCCWQTHCDIVIQVNDEYLRTLEILSKKLKFVEADLMVKSAKALKDVQPELDKLRQKAVSKVVIRVSNNRSHVNHLISLCACIWCTWHIIYNWSVWQNQCPLTCSSQVVKLGITMLVLTALWTRFYNNECLVTCSNLGEGLGISKTPNFSVCLYIVMSWNGIQYQSLKWIEYVWPYCMSDSSALCTG